MKTRTPTTKAQGGGVSAAANSLTLQPPRTPLKDLVNVEPFAVGLCRPPLPTKMLSTHNNDKKTNKQTKKTNKQPKKMKLSDL